MNLSDINPHKGLHKRATPDKMPDNSPAREKDEPRLTAYDDTIGLIVYKPI